MGLEIESKMKTVNQKQDEERKKRVRAIESEVSYSKWLQETEERKANKRMEQFEKKYHEELSKEKEKQVKHGKKIEANTRFLEWLCARGFQPKATVHDRLSVHATKQHKTQKYGREN